MAINLIKERVDLIKKTVKRKEVLELVDPIYEKILQLGLDRNSSRVAFVLDFSGSMRTPIQQGWQDKAVYLAGLVGLILDDDGSIPVIGYATLWRRLPDLTVDNLENYVQYVMGLPYPGPDRELEQALRELKAKTRCTAGRLDRGFIHGLGIDNIEPLALDAVFDLIQSEKDQSKPWLIPFFTDGGIDHRLYGEIVSRLVAGKSVGGYFQYLGLGGNKRSYGVLTELDTKVAKKGAQIDTCGFELIDNINRMTPSDMVDVILTKDYVEYIKKARFFGIVG